MPRSSSGKKKTPGKTKKAPPRKTAVRSVRTKKPEPFFMGTFSIKKILVPIDFSEYSKNALKYAVPFAAQFGAEIVLVYVVEPTIYPADLSFGQFGIPDVEEELSRKGDAELTNLIATEIKSEVKARKKVCIGKPFIEIIKTARDEEADLIILSTHGHTGVEHILFGSTAEKVVRKAPCPVLSLRPNEREFVMP